MVETLGNIEDQASEATIQSFHLMWDAFPHVVLLLNKSKTVLEVNKMGRDLGVPVGIKCYQLSKADVAHPDTVCKADVALEEGVGKRSVGATGGRVLDSYWLPLDNEEGLYLHFAVDITEYAKEEMLSS